MAFLYVNPICKTFFFSVTRGSLSILNHKKEKPLTTPLHSFSDDHDDRVMGLSWFSGSHCMLMMECAGVEVVMRGCGHVCVGGGECMWEEVWDGVEGCV